jgi:aspartyl protease
MALSDDIAWFEANRVIISRQYPGMHILVKNQAVVGVYPDYQTAYNAGVAMFGTEPFLVKLATEEQFVERGFMSGMGRRIPFMGQQVPVSVAEKLRRDGALVKVQISVPKTLADQMRAEGKTVPAPRIATGLIDTGASISTVSEQVASEAGLQAVGSVPISGVGGTQERPVMSAAFALPEYGIDVDPIEIVAVSINAPGFEILVGRDVLQALELKYTGFQGIFNLNQDLMPSGGGAGKLGTAGWVGIGAAAAAAGVGLLFALDVL